MKLKSSLLALFLLLGALSLRADFFECAAGCEQILALQLSGDVDTSPWSLDGIADFFYDLGATSSSATSGTMNIVAFFKGNGDPSFIPGDFYSFCDGCADIFDDMSNGYYATISWANGIIDSNTFIKNFKNCIKDCQNEE